jgi:hypothetical protein
LEGIVTSFIRYILENKQAAGDAYGEAKDIQRSISLPLQKIPHADDEKVLYHDF